MDSIFIEFVEVYICSVLYLRGLYPTQIFKRRKFCNLPVWCSIYPKLNDYLREIYLAIRDLKQKSQLGQIDLLIYRGSIENIVENHVIEVDKDFEAPEQDKYLMNTEEKFRKSLLALEKRSKNLKPLGKDCKFRIFLHTTESSYIHLCSESKFQDFLWIQEDNKKILRKSENAEILPILMNSLDSCGMQLYIEKLD